MQNRESLLSRQINLLFESERVYPLKFNIICRLFKVQMRVGEILNTASLDRWPSLGGASLVDIELTFMGFALCLV